MSKVNSSRLRPQSPQWESKHEKLKKSSVLMDSQTWLRKPIDNMSTVQRKQKSNCFNQGNTRNNGHRGQTAGSVKSRDLSQDDLLFLLSMLEGELQARDEVITVLKADKTDMALLESQYGFVTPLKVLQALQRDTIQGKGCDRKEDIYEKPIAELDKLMEKQRETYRQMLEQVLMVEQAHKQSLYRLEDEKQNHSEYMKKSDEFTNLLEQERERLKLVIDQEKAYQNRKEEENNKKITSLKDELTKLKSFALLVIDEQQRATEQLAQHAAKVQELQTAATKAQEELISARTKTQELESKVFSLEADSLDQSSRLKQEKEVMTAKLTNEDSQNRQLRQKLSVLSRQLDELEESNKTLRRAEEELQELREKISRGECGNPSLVSEVEELRKRVLEMEGKDEELIKVEDMCRDLNKKLEKESNQSQGLKEEVDKLNHRIMELEKLEDSFGKSKQECNSLKCNLEKERTITKHMAGELEVLRGRIKELEASEGQLEKTEWTLKEDLAKLKTLTVMLVDERKTMAEKLKHLEDKVQNSTEKLHAEQDRVTLVTEKLIGESKKALRSKAELEEKMCTALKERDELKSKLKAEQEKNNDLQSKVNMMKKRLQSLEAVEIEFLRNKSKEENPKGSLPNHFQLEDNQVKYLTQELERLKCKLKERNVAEDGRMKAENVCESLEKKYSNEQQRAKVLMEELELSQKELSNYQLVEKETSDQHTLYMHLKKEEAKSSELTKEVEALKETIHKYMDTEETICHMKTEHATLRRKLTQQEIRNKELAREMETLTRELERYRRFSKSLRPGMNGRRFSDLHVSTKEVQTEATDSFTSNYKNLALLERAVVNGKLYEDSDNEDEPSYNEISFIKRNPSLLNKINNINLDNNTKQTKSLLLKTMENPQPINDKIPPRQSRSQIQQGDKFVTHSPGQPLHIKVTPDHDHNTATLEITSPTSDKSQSYTTTAVIPTIGAPPKQRITIIQNSPLSPHNNFKSSPSTESLCTPDGSVSPLTTYSHRGTPEFRSVMTPERDTSPTEMVSIMTEVPERTHSEEAVEITAGHTVVCLTPQKSNSWQLQRSNSTGPNVITTEDNKIHIHFGHPYIQTMNQPASPCKSPGQEQKTPVITSGPPVKGNNKIASSIIIKPNSSPISQPSQITIPLEAFRQSGPTKIPKPKGCCSKTGLNTVPNDNKGIPPAPINFGKSVSNNLNMLDIPTNS